MKKEEFWKCYINSTNLYQALPDCQKKQEERGRLLEIIKSQILITQKAQDLYWTLKSHYIQLLVDSLISGEPEEGLMEEFDSVGTYADIVNSSSDPKKVMRKIRKNMRLLKPVLSVVKSKYTSPEIERLANLYEELSKIQFKDLVTA